MAQASFALPPPKPVVVAPATPITTATTSSSSTGSKRKLEDDDTTTHAVKTSNKKPAHGRRREEEEEQEAVASSSEEEEEEGEDLEDNDAELSELDDEDEAALLDELDEEEEEDPDEEEQDSDGDGKATKAATGASSAPSKSKDKKAATRSKYTPPDETREQKDARTIFVGNVPVAAVKNKSLQKQLSRQLAALAGPKSKVESIRFRSVAFAAPTAPEDDDDGEKEKKLSRERERAAAWKREHAAEDDKKGGGSSLRRSMAMDSEAEPLKTFFRPGERRRVAFIKKDLHPDVQVANAYIVFAHPAPDRSTNVAPVMDPTEAAAEVVRRAHESPVIFEGRVLRVDAVRATLTSIAMAAAESGTSTLPLKRRVWTAGRDPKMSLYVGNLVYAAKEDDLRAFVESLLVGEKGQPPQQQQAEGGGAASWVEDVRIIRDRDTQMGKGFAYVAMRVSAKTSIKRSRSRPALAAKPLIN